MPPVHVLSESGSFSLNLSTTRSAVGLSTPLVFRSSKLHQPLISTKVGSKFPSELAVEPLPLPASPSEGQQQAWWAADGQARAAQPVEEAVVLDVVVDDGADSAVEAEVVADGAAQVRAMEAKVAALEARVNKLKQQKKRGSE